MQTKHLMWWGVVIGVVLCVAVGTHAQRRIVSQPGSGSGGGQKWAVIIGIDAFDDPNIGTLRYTVSDAVKLHETLTTMAGGFPKDNMMLMTPQASDRNHRPTRNNIIGMLTSWLDLANAGDTVLVYFSGHGIEVDGESYLVSSDTKLSNPALTGVSLGFVKKQMRLSKARRRILILDACHSGEGKATPRMGQALNRALNDAEGMVTLASCGLDESSYEMRDEPHGAFTYYLMEALKGAADRDGNGEVWASEAYSYTYEQTRRWAARQGLKQRPKYVAAIQGEIVLADGVHRPDRERLPVAPRGMVRVPGGAFQMGTDASAVDELFEWSKQFYSSFKREWVVAETPRHWVELDAFYVDVHEVTNAEYKAFVDANRSWSKSGIDETHHDGDYLDDWDGNSYPSGKGDHPVTWVSWHAANAYCEWLGKRLPTEAEWEYAARGGDEGRKYVWGNSDTPPSGAGNFADETAKKSYPSWTIVEGYDDGYAETSPVGSFSVNGYGLYDMAGNVWEWCSDWYGAYPSGCVKNPTGPKLSSYRVLRGGSWDYNPRNLRVANRNGNSPTDANFSNGFRCAQDALVP